MELMKLMEDWKGYVALNDVNKGDGYEQKLSEVIDLLSNARNLPPYKHEYLLREALTTSDFPLLFGDVLDRQVLASYKATPAVWKAFTKLTTVRDFRQVSRYFYAGGDEHLDLVAEKGEYLASDRVEDRYYYQIYKYGRQFDISWEAMINDDLDALKDTPERFVKAAIRTEHRIVTALYVHNVTMATALRGNLVTNLLTINNLETALEWFGARTDVGGEAIAVRAKYLVVPPALELTARQILTSATKMWLDASLRAGGRPRDWAMPMTNVVSNMGLELIIDPYIDILDATTTGQSAWYLFADPKDLVVLEAAHLRGHERPEICMKASDKVTVGGGAINPMAGDFATDNIFYRVRLCFGGGTQDWRGFYFGGHIS